MPQIKVRLLPEELQSIDSATFTGSYQTLGTLTKPSRIFKITNNSTVDVTVSWDGSTDHEYIPTGTFILLDCTSDAGSSGVLEVAVGTVFSVKGSAGTGSVYLSSYYAA